MTLVTTSRRSTPVIRSIAKDFAFASGFTYLTRGKHGLREIAGDNDLFLVIECQKSETMLTVYTNGIPSLCRIIREHKQGIREGPLFRGVKTSDQKLGSVLAGSCTVEYFDNDQLILCFDGPQKRYKQLVLIPGVANEA
ncbi:MAG: hypothetical protein GXY48_01440 [Methanomicrobiales archaeon]|nr:hypothetical protein [Methanomicrobiales archaeon]